MLIMNILILIGLINGTYLALIKDFDDLSNGDADNDLLGWKSCLPGVYLDLTLPPFFLHSHIVLSGPSQNCPQIIVILFILPPLHSHQHIHQVVIKIQPNLPNQCQFHHNHDQYQYQSRPRPILSHLLKLFSVGSSSLSTSTSYGRQNFSLKYSMQHF